MIELKNVSTGFHSSIVSSGLELKINKGEILSVVGPNGCGKTTFLKTASGLLSPVSGAVTVSGLDIRKYSRRALARTVAFLPQIHSVPDISVQALISHGRFPHLNFSRHITALDKERIERAMELTGTAGFRHKNVATLSGGERQRVYIAMTVAQDTPVVIWDEPTTFLDISCQLDIMELAGKLNAEGTTVVMSLHDIPAALQYSSRICVMDFNRKIRMTGSAEEIYASGILEQLYSVSSRSFEANGHKHYCFYR